MAEGLLRNSGRGEEITPGQSQNSDEIYSSQPSNQAGDLGEGKITPGQPSNLDETNPGQPPQVEDGDGSGLTEAESMEGELSPILLRLDELITELRNHPIDFTKSTKELEETIQTAFKYIQQFGRDDDRSKLLAGRVVQIADELEAAVITRSTEFSHETKADFLKRLISLMVVLISSVGPNDFEFRGRKTEISLIDHPNNALLKTLDFAASVLLVEAAEDPQKLIDAISSLLEMTQELWDDELESIHNKILVQIFVMIKDSVMENGKIDDNLKEQIADWFIKYFRSTVEIRLFVRQLLHRVPSDLKLLETLSQKLNKFARENKNDSYWYRNSYLHECFNGGITNLELEVERIEIYKLRGRIEALEKKNERLREENERLNTQDQRLNKLRRLSEQTGIQTDKEK